MPRFRRIKDTGAGFCREEKPLGTAYGGKLSIRKRKPIISEGRLMCHIGKLLRWPVAVAFLLLLAACAHEPGPTRPTAGVPVPSSSLADQAATPHTQPPPKTVPARGQGRIRGMIVRPPGGDPRSGHGGGTVPLSGDPVHAYDSDGHVVASAASGRDGRFEFSVPAGTYRVVEDICGTAQQVQVASGATAAVTLTVPNSC
jgi:hypothetical protein